MTLTEAHFFAEDVFWNIGHSDQISGGFNMWGKIRADSGDADGNAHKKKRLLVIF
jgi:hypothetical protein